MLHCPSSKSHVLGDSNNSASVPVRGPVTAVASSKGIFFRVARCRILIGDVLVIFQNIIIDVTAGPHWSGDDVTARFRLTNFSGWPA